MTLRECLIKTWAKYDVEFTNALVIVSDFIKNVRETGYLQLIHNQEVYGECVSIVLNLQHFNETRLTLRGLLIQSYSENVLLCMSEKTHKLVSRIREEQLTTYFEEAFECVDPDLILVTYYEKLRSHTELILPTTDDKLARLKNDIIHYKKTFKA